MDISQRLPDDAPNYVSAIHGDRLSAIHRSSQKKMDAGREASKVPSELGGLDTGIHFFSEASNSSKIVIAQKPYN